ncbi:MAG: fimbrillin family protein [Prevotella sp.]|jgi:hypothetical protein|nr:fimbrillin family protein [Prevotella sp.]MDR2005419.1 fimbrillin family protein [Prevotella sp.]
MKKFKLLSLAIIALLFAACSNDDDTDSSGNRKAITFNTSIGGTVTSQAKASGSSWDSGDAIGVYMKTGTGLSNIVGNGANKKYTTPGTGNFSPATTNADALYYPEDGNNVDFIAYYPYTASIVNNVYKVDVTTQSSQEAIDLLYSGNASGLNKNNTTANLNFEHQLVKIVFTVNAGNGITSLGDLKVTLKNTNTKADFALDTKTLSEADSKADIALKMTTGAQQATAEGIILPSTSTAGRIVTFTTSQGVFTWEVPSTVVFEAGKKNSYNVELKLGGGNGVFSNGTITDWGTGSSENIVIDLGGNDSDGSRTNPYTISQLSSKVGETAKWVTGYIVGSTSKTKAFGASKTNILIAATAGETDETKCIPVDIDGSAVQSNLDIVTNPDLIGQAVKVQGNIVNNIFGGVVALTAITAQEGGKENGGETEKEFFFENFGPDDMTYPSGNRPKVAAHTAWLMQAPVTYTDASGNIDIRTATNITPSAWIPANKVSALLIEGIEGGYKNITLSYDVAAGSGSGNTEGNTLKVSCNGVTQDVPGTILAKTNEYATINIQIPDNTTTLEFSLEASSTIGFRLDNVRLKGTK